MSLQFRSLRLDEPTCLQLCTALDRVPTLTSVDLRNCALGANGALLVAGKIRLLADKLRKVDLTGIAMGPIAAIQIGDQNYITNCQKFRIWECSADFLGMAIIRGGHSGSGLLVGGAAPGPQRYYG